MPNRVEAQAARPVQARPEANQANRAPRADTPVENPPDADPVELSSAARQAQASRAKPAQPERGATIDASGARSLEANESAADRAEQLRDQQTQRIQRDANETEPGETGSLVDVTGG